VADQKTLELQIKILAQQALAQVSALSGDLKSLSGQAGRFAADSKGVADSLKRYEGEASRAAASMKLFGATTADVQRQQELAKKAAADLVSAGLKPESKEVQGLVSQYRQFESQARAMDKANRDNIKSFGDLKTAVAQTGAAVALIKTAEKTKDLAAFALAQADAFQNARNEFGILLGDMEAGAGLFDRVKAFNDKTPFSMETTKQAVNVLLSADVPLSQINSRLAQFGDLSQGNAQKFSSYVDAFSKGAAKGKVDMEVLNTYLRQGVPILAELANGFQTDKAAIVEMVSQGKVSFADFSDALDRLTAEGGRYFGGMELGSRSLAAMQEGLKESTNALAASYGNMLMPAMTSALGLFANLINAVNESPLLKGIIAGAVVALAGYLAALAAKQAALAVKTWLAYAAQMGLNSAMAVGNPLLLAGIAAAAATTVAAVAYASSQQKAAERTNAAATAAREQSEAYSSAEAAARQYAQILDDLGISAQRGVRRDAENEVARLYQETARLQRLAASTPQRLTERHELMPGSGDYMTVDYGANPSYERCQQSLEAANAQLAQAQARVAAINARMGELAESSLAAFGTEWKDKLLTGIEAVNREEDKAIGELKAKAFSAFKEGFEANSAYQAELGALQEFYRRKRAEGEKKDAGELGEYWQDKMLSGTAAIDREQQRSMKDLRAKALETFGANYETQAAYIAELAALNGHYDEKRNEHEKRAREALLEESLREREELMRAHELRMENVRKEWEYRRELARQDGSHAQFAGAEAMLAMGGTDVGDMIGAIQSGGSPWMMLISIVIKAVSQLESFGEALNFITNFVKNVFGKIDGLIQNAMSGLYDAFDELGEVIAAILPMITFFTKSINDAISFAIKMLMPALKITGEVFAWLYNKVLVPAGNKIIDLMNGIIDIVNCIPGVNVKKLEYFEYAGQLAEDMAKEMERRKDEIARLYERQKDRVRDELAAQISSIRQQYELGLISRADYERQAEQYQAAADTKLLDINEEMNEKLDAIKNNTHAALSEEQKRSMDEEGSLALGGIAQAGAAFIDPVTTGIVSAAVDASNGNWGDAALNFFTGGLWGAGKKLFRFDVGTPYVPEDMAAMIHRGEGIVPRSFNEGIQAGDYALVGRDWHGGRGGTKTATAVNVSVFVEGSVIRERGLVEAVHEGISRGIESGELEPLPA
jgi:tape measure domain-containing protein